jgi:type II secretory pathway pseudopilin PulG
MRRTVAREDGITIVEVLVAALVLVIGGFATFGVLRAATLNTQRAKASQVALDRAQQEMEKLRSLSNKELALTATPSSTADVLNPNHRVSNAEFALLREPPSEYKRMVVNGGELYGGGVVEGGTVNPGPTSFSSGDVKGTIYRYVVWHDDPNCPVARCPGKQDYKQIIVAVKLDTPPNQTAERGYVEVQSAFIDPKDTPLNDPLPGAEGVVTAQQFFLSDTACAASGTTARAEISGDHTLHNTLGTCASGPQTGSTLGAPDALLIGAPPDPAPEDENNPPVYDYSSDYPSPPSPETAKGIQLRRDDTAGCHYVPTGKTAPQWQAHRWVTDKMSASFTLSGKVTLDFFTRTLSDLPYTATLCAYLFDRGETGSPPTATDTMLKDKGSAFPYWSYTPSAGGGIWWHGKWEEVRLTMEFTGPIKIPAGDRLGVALTVDGKSGGEAIDILYDHPKYRTRIEVDTPTPLEGG